MTSGCNGAGQAAPAIAKSVPYTIPQGLLVPSSLMIDFGAVPQGARREATFWLTNPTDQPVEVEKIETSCPCLTVELHQAVIPPGEQVAARLKVDFTGDDFNGRLRMEVMGKTKEGAVAFALECKVGVGPNVR